MNYEWRCEKCDAVNGVSKDTVRCPWCNGRVVRGRKVTDAKPESPPPKKTETWYTWDNELIPGTLSLEEKQRRRDQYEEMARLAKTGSTIKCGRCGKEILPHEILGHVCEQNK